MLRGSPGVRHSPGRKSGWPSCGERLPPWRLPTTTLRADAHPLAAQQKLIEQRDALFAVNDAILRAQTTEEILQRIVDLAPDRWKSICVSSCCYAIRTSWWWPP